MLQNKFEYLVGFFCCVTDSTGKEYTRHYIDKPADSAQRDARSAYNNTNTTNTGNTSTINTANTTHASTTTGSTSTSIGTSANTKK